MLNIDSMFESSKMLFDYLTKNRGYNLYIIDEIDGQEVAKLKKAIDENNKVEAVHQYLKLDREVDKIRDKYCYNNPELPYRSSFRSIAKELYLELKKTWFIYDDDFAHLFRLLKFISTSDYYIIREYLARRSLTLYMYGGVPMHPNEFYCGFYTLEYILDYTIKLYLAYMKDM